MKHVWLAFKITDSYEDLLGVFKLKGDAVKKLKAAKKEYGHVPEDMMEAEAKKFTKWISEADRVYCQFCESDVDFEYIAYREEVI
jgi:hypothetical protein